MCHCAPLWTLLSRGWHGKQGRSRPPAVEQGLCHCLFDLRRAWCITYLQQVFSPVYELWWVGARRRGGCWGDAKEGTGGLLSAELGPLGATIGVLLLLPISAWAGEGPRRAGRQGWGMFPRGGLLLVALQILPRGSCLCIRPGLTPSQEGGSAGAAETVAGKLLGGGSHHRPLTQAPECGRRGGERVRRMSGDSLLSKFTLLVGVHSPGSLGLVGGRAAPSPSRASCP